MWKMWKNQKNIQNKAKKLWKTLLINCGYFFLLFFAFLFSTFKLKYHIDLLEILSGGDYEYG